MSDRDQTYEYRPVGDLAQKVKYLFIIQIVITCVAIWSGWLELNLLNDAKDGLKELTEADANPIDQRQMIVGIFQFAILVISLISF